MTIQPSSRVRKVFSLALIIALFLTLACVPGSKATFTTLRQSYIVQGDQVEAVAHLVERYGGQVTSRLEIINGVGALLSPEAAARLAGEPGIKAVTLNQAVKLSGRQSGRTPASDYPDVVGADLTWQQGESGAGVTVAVLDTGLAPHPGLLQGIDGRPRGRIVAWKDYIGRSKEPVDPNGHGTHVAGVIANTQVGEDGEWVGVAPGVRLVGVRVLDEEGAGTYEKVILGLQWVLSHKDEYHIRVVNLSLVSQVQSPYWADPLNQAVMRAWASGIVVVAAAGNGGPGPMTVGVPGNNPYIITAGAFTDNYTPDNWNDDYIAPFSAAGPTLDGFVKPDVVAPGAHMVSSMLPASYVARHHLADKVTPLYYSMAGTSQSAAVVSGVAALVIGKHPELTPDEVKYRLMVTAFPWVDVATGDGLYSLWQQGYGRVNTPDAVFADIQGRANTGMDINADLAGTLHYEGYSYYDSETGLFRLRGDYSDWANGFGTWSGGFGTWSGGFGTWSGGFGTWSGGFGTWSGGIGTWSGGFGTWSGGFGTWSGGFGTWSGGFGTWSGSEPWGGSIYANPAFVTSFLAGVSPNAATTSTFVPNWVDEP
jgi:serine protease AprX